MNRKSLFSASIALATLLSSQSSFALAQSGANLVKMSAQCQTKDGRLEISIYDKQGTGPVRQSDLSAEIRSTKNDEVLATYEVEAHVSGAIGSPIRFIDVGTNGQDFNLSGRSSRSLGYFFEGKLENGMRVRPQEVDCSIFNGVNKD